MYFLFLIYVQIFDVAGTALSEVLPLLLALRSKPASSNTCFSLSNLKGATYLLTYKPDFPYTHISKREFLSICTTHVLKNKTNIYGG